ncbi:hypothetical protein KFE96_14890 [Kordiimonas sp. SCSIO 12603]|uniref:hypothetical protein n=1 Tax=Kordiimonas sp. SCSIO 12603 TaxID=2829596 RepID=UPI002103C08E|nr:hypothetical protein [Kordiimonas sp. SCSIO 12603]UTW58094.1 hypothetical protein KFE96_14890 [Kordiimonas sp. SCSIO 12603]
MIESLQNLIRLRKWELDEARRVLAEMLEERDEMVRRIEAIDAEMADQSKNSELEVFATSLGAYMEGSRKQQKIIYDQIVQKDTVIEEQQDKVAESFRELKTYEIALEQQQKKKAQKLAKFEQDMLDEQGLQRYFQKDDMFDSAQ